MILFLKRIPASVILFLFFFSVYAFTASAIFQFGDEMEKYKVAQSIVERGDFSFRPTQYRNKISVSGQTVSVYELGQSIAIVPLYALGRVVYNWFPRPDINDVTLLFAGWFNPIVTALTCAILFETARRVGFRRATSVALSVLYGLTTVAWAYTRNLTREPLMALLIMLTLYAVISFARTEDWRWLIAAGLAAGYLVFTKFIQGAFIPLFAAYVLVCWFQTQKAIQVDRRALLRTAAKGLALFALPALLFLVLQSLYAFVRFGTFVGGQGSENFVLQQIWIEITENANIPAAIVGLIFSPDKGMFVYSPPTVLFLFSWHQWYKQSPREALLILGLVLVGFFSGTARGDWGGGGYWGPRYVMQIVPLLILPIGARLDSPDENQRRRWCAVVGAFFAFGLMWQIVGAITNDREYLDVYGKVTNMGGQLDWLRHGVIESLVVYLSPAGLQINPYGIVLAVVAAVLAGWIVWRSKENADAVESRWSGLIALTTVLAVEFAALIVWMIVPLTQVQTARGNTQYVAANRFYDEGRRCEARMMYSTALERGTTYQRETVARLDELFPRAAGDPFTTEDLMAEVEKPANVNALVQRDDQVSITGQGSLMLRIPPGQDATLGANSVIEAVAPGTPYEISGWIKTEAAYGKGYAVIVVYEDNGRWGQSRAIDLAGLDETYGWRPFRRTFTTLPTTKRLMILTRLWQTYGTVWVDGIQLAQITPETASANPSPGACTAP